MDVLLEDADVRLALEIINARIDRLRSEEVQKMPELPEKNYVDVQAKKIHGEYAVIVNALPNRVFEGKNGSGSYEKPQLEVEFVKDKARKVWYLDRLSQGKFAEKYGTNTDAWVNFGVRFKEISRVVGKNEVEALVGEPVSLELIKAATMPQQTLGGASASPFVSAEDLA